MFVFHLFNCLIEGKGCFCFGRIRKIFHLRKFTFYHQSLNFFSVFSLYRTLFCCMILQIYWIKMPSPQISAARILFSLFLLEWCLNISVCVFARFLTLIYLVKTVPVFSFPLMYGCCVLFHRFLLIYFIYSLMVTPFWDYRQGFGFDLQKGTIDLASDAGKSFVFFEWMIARLIFG